MARCGIRLRYPVKILYVDDGGEGLEGPLIGDAETLGQAVVLAEKQGFQVREMDEGGNSRFSADEYGSALCFIITVYPAQRK